MRICYKILGQRITNFLINKTVGGIFTSGETIESLMKDIESLEKRKIKGVANYVAEGIHEMDETIILKTLQELMDTIKALTEGEKQGHLAIKLTSMISIDIMTRISKA